MHLQLFEYWLRKCQGLLSQHVAQPSSIKYASQYSCDAVCHAGQLTVGMAGVISSVGAVAV